MPVSTPAGILTVSARRERTRPSPEHSRQGSGMTVPKPRQAAQGRRVRISPRKERCTWATSPWPRQVSQGTGWLPGAAPSPPQVVQQHGGVDLELAGDAEGGLGEVDLEADQRVLAAAYARTRTTALATALSAAAEEGVHDVGEGKPGALAETTGPGTAERVAAAVVGRPLLRVGEHLVGRARPP